MKEQLITAAEESFLFRLWWGAQEITSDDAYEVAFGWTVEEDEDVVLASEDPANYWFLLLVAEAVDD